MVIWGNSQIWVLTEAMALPGFHLHVVHISASVMGWMAGHGSS